MVAFLTAGNILLEAIMGAAGLGWSWTSYLAGLLGRHSDALRIHVPALAQGFNLLDPIAVVILITTSVLAMSGARLTSTINSLASVVGIIIIAFVMSMSNWVMEERYGALKELGTDNFGVARLVRDKHSKELIAVKYIERGKKFLMMMVEWFR